MHRLVRRRRVAHHKNTYLPLTARLPPRRKQGFLYRGSSDLELGNDVDNGECGQHIGIRLQGVSVPAGAVIRQANIKFTIDESTNPTIINGFVGADSPVGDEGDAYWVRAALESPLKASHMPRMLGCTVVHVSGECAFIKI